MAAMSDVSRLELVASIGRALCRKRQVIPIAQGTAWNQFNQAQLTNGLLVLERNGEHLARGVYQAGELVYVTARGQENQAAIAVLASERFDVQFYPLDRASQCLLLAAVAGEVLETGVSRVLSQVNLVETLQLQLFDGAVLLELGIQSICVRMMQGHFECSQSLAQTPLRYRCTKIAWQETKLPSIETNAKSTMILSSRMTQEIPTSREDLIFGQFETLIRSYLGLEASAVMQATKAELRGIPEQQLVTQLKSRLQKIGSSVVLDFENRIGQSS